MLVVGFEQRLPIIGIIQGVVLFQKLPNNVGPSCIAQERRLGIRKFHILFRYIEADWWRDAGNTYQPDNFGESFTHFTINKRYKINIIHYN
uniref:Uncharacterized protein n=1 Tax=Anopheles minimus TaxID=112268 RepID=A0A182WNI6_9DIPT